MPGNRRLYFFIICSVASSDQDVGAGNPADLTRIEFVDPALYFLLTNEVPEFGALYHIEAHSDKFSDKGVAYGFAGSFPVAMEPYNCSFYSWFVFESRFNNRPETRCASGQHHENQYCDDIIFH